MCNGECEFRTVIYQGEEYPDLEISRCGIMRNRNTGNIYAWTSCGTKYLCAMYTKGGRAPKKRMRQHRVLMETFVPNPENKPQINHIDGNKFNNSLSNLEWCTAEENREHAIRTGLQKRCLAEEDVIYLRENIVLHDKEKSIVAMAKKFGVGVTVIRDAYYGNTWKKVGVKK